MNSSSTTLEPLFGFLSYSLATVETTFYQLPGSAVVARYVKSSHQNDPGRSILELILVIFVVRTLLQSRTRTDRTGKNFIQFTEKEIDELVDEWTPDPLARPLDETQQADLDNLPIIAGPNSSKPTLLSTGKTVINLASYNFNGLAGNEDIKQGAIETLRKYGLGSCGPPGFYGTLDVHTDLENDIAEFLGTEASILYSQDFSTISSVIPAFCKRGDIIVADRGVNFAIQKGIQISRSIVRWFDHNDLKSLEDVLESVEKERRKRRGPLTRRFIVTEGIFEKDGAMVDLPKLIELKYKHKYRLILDESFSFGTVGKNGRGLTELYNIPASQIDMLVGSVATGLCSSGGFCAGSRIVVDHQRINGTSFVFSASMPALLAVSASAGINLLRDDPSVMSRLQENINTARAVLTGTEGIIVPSHPTSPIQHIYVRAPTRALLPSFAATMSPISIKSTTSPFSPKSPNKSNPASIIPRDPPLFDIEAEERLLQEVVELALERGVFTTRARRLRGQEMTEARPSIRLAISSALTKEETEHAVGVVREALTAVLVRWRS